MHSGGLNHLISGSQRRIQDAFIAIRSDLVDSVKILTQSVEVDDELNFSWTCEFQRFLGKHCDVVWPTVGKQIDQSHKSLCQHQHHEGLRYLTRWLIRNLSQFPYSNFGILLCPPVTANRRTASHSSSRLSFSLAQRIRKVKVCENAWGKNANEWKCSLKKFPDSAFPSLGQHSGFKIVNTNGHRLWYSRISSSLR